MWLLPLALLLLSVASCAKPEQWSAIVHATETSLEHRTMGVYPTVQECLVEGRKQKGKGYLECGLHCKWDAQGLFNCEKVVRLMEHQLPQ